jgi:hypothetical protein
LVASAPPASIHPTSWKGCSPKSGCTILHRFRPRKPLGALYVLNELLAFHDMLCCRIKMRILECGRARQGSRDEDPPARSPILTRQRRTGRNLFGIPSASSRRQPSGRYDRALSRASAVTSPMAPAAASPMSGRSCESSGLVARPSVCRHPRDGPRPAFFGCGRSRRGVWTRVDVGPRYHQILIFRRRGP